MDFAEKIAVAEWALHGNRCWIGLSVERHLGRAEYVAVYQPGPYSAPAVVPNSHSDGFFESLRIGKEWLEAKESQANTEGGK
jgi:hypothetical protein